MEDVKDIVEIAMRVWVSLLAILFGLVMLMGFLAGWAEAGNALKNGARLTLVIMGILLLGVIIIFPIVFVAFHEIFFDPGTWMFSFQDSLIRLFPQRFWQVAFLAVGLLTGIQAAVLFLVGQFFSRSSGLVPQ
jgi:integral membrane protein (TIGR01906 family)